jgi:hypothetical protein
MFGPDILQYFFDEFDTTPETFAPLCMVTFARLAIVTNDAWLSCFITGTGSDTAKDRTDVAGKWYESPAWLTVKVQTPSATIVTSEPHTVHTFEVDEFNVTLKPESDDAATANDLVDNTLFAGTSKAIF